jgi:hypothetical protein
MILRGGPHEYEWYHPNPKKSDRCMLCHGPLHFPVLQWSPCYRGDNVEDESRSRFLCKECCAEMLYGGFLRDLRKMKTLKELRALGFHKAEPTQDTVFIPPETNQH